MKIYWPAMLFTAATLISGLGLWRALRAYEARRHAVEVVYNDIVRSHGLVVADGLIAQSPLQLVLTALLVGFTAAMALTFWARRRA